MASSDLTGSSLLDDDISAEDRLAADAEASHGSLLDDEREADIGLEVQSDTGIMGDISAGDDAVSQTSGCNTIKIHGLMYNFFVVFISFISL